MRFTPTYSSWINQVERLFAEATRDLLQRSDHRNVQALEKDLRNWIKAWNENPKPFIWIRPPTRSSNPSDDYYNELTAQHTRGSSSGPRSRQSSVTFPPGKP